MSKTKGLGTRIQFKKYEQLALDFALEYDEMFSRKIRFVNFEQLALDFSRDYSQKLPTKVQFLNFEQLALDFSQKYDDIKLQPFEDVVVQYDKMIWKIVNRFYKNHSATYEKEELYQFGLFGLWKAYENYDCKKGCKFITYAHTNISGWISAEINKEKETKYGVSRDHIKRKEIVTKCLKKMEVENWSYEEAFQESGLTRKEWNEAVEWNLDTVSIFADVGRSSGEHQELIEYIPGELDSEAKILDQESVAEFFTFVDNAIEEEMLRLRLIEGFNKLETSKILNMPPTTYYRKEKELFSKIKYILEKPQAI
ncbi:sigma-70 family RNA polymerase sigma factor [Bacillus cereus]|uniref:sigma-70 family RNA polymerase sigma factor n=1 Tax=Bacillus cereus TaxID=1396 RepID=UPI000B4BF982|nr:sigma-70 family RNA polymerase sigma factor [Bacillus cereus]